jgi:hypothetical protein
MDFNSNIADEKLIYDSIHPTFMQIVKSLYFRIVDLNSCNDNNYFSNIIILYNKWATRCKENK